MATKKERGGVIDQEAAERLLRRYLDERGWRYDREHREFGGKRPDAVILSEAGDPIGVIEAVAIDEGVELGQTVREVLACGMEQASPVAAAGLPYLIAAHIPGCPSMKRIAHLITDELMRSSAISAFGILRELDVAEIYKQLQKDCQSGAHALKPHEATAMEVLLNPQATVAWLQELWGIYDHVWTWDARKKKLQKIYDGREELMRTYRILLHAGTVPAPLKEGVSASRSEDFYEERY